MKSSKPTPTKGQLHPANKHHGRYDMAKLTNVNPRLNDFIVASPSGEPTIQFSDVEAVVELNRAILMADYGVQFWSIPEGYLCPPIPGRADYLHYVADLLGSSNRGDIPTGPDIRVLDIGTGSNLIYPIIGNRTYGWSFMGIDIDAQALENAKMIIDRNDFLKDKVKVFQQRKPDQILDGILNLNLEFDVCICNPPFFADENEAFAANQRKWKNLGTTPDKAPFNFGGSYSELIYPGGEALFISRYMSESARYKHKSAWFTTIVSQDAHLPRLKAMLSKLKPADIRVMEMSQGQKKSRILAWTFLSYDEMDHWTGSRFWSNA